MVRTLVTALGILCAGNAFAGCFDRELLITRYHYTLPNTVDINWQDICLLDMTALPAIAATRLTRGAVAATPYDNTGAAWSPDGSRIVFRSSRVGNGQLAFYAMDPVDADMDGEGDNLAGLGEDNAELNGPHWPAGRVFLFSKGDANDIAQVYGASITAAGDALNSVTALTTGGTYRLDPQWDSSLTWILYADANFVDGQGWFSALILLDPATGTETVLSPALARDAYPAWIPGTMDIVFSRAVGPEPGQHDLWRATVDTSGTPQLTGLMPLTATPMSGDTSAALSADGACLAYLVNDFTVTYGPNSDLVIRDMATQETRQITVTRDLSGAAWRP